MNRSTQTETAAARRRPATPETPANGAASSYHPPYAAAGLAALAVLALYAITLAPTTKFWDASEYIATGHIMGIPHPPGNPTFVILARAWDLLLAPLGLSTAVKINLFSATISALAHGFWFLVVHRILAYYSPERLFRLAGAVAAVALSAAAFTVWHQSNVNEKVYTVSLFTIAALSWLAFRWRDWGTRDAESGALLKGGVTVVGGGNLLLLMVFLLALSVGNHLMAFLAAPAIFVFMLMVEPRTFLNWRLYAFGAVVAAIGLSSHLFLPLRASLGPIINQADPSTWTALWESLTRQQYDKPSVLLDPVLYAFREEVPRGISLMLAQAANYLQYFDWQWARSVAGPDTWFGGMRPLVTLAIVALGLYGAWTHYQRDRVSCAYVGILFLTLSAGLVFYLNFRYGYSFPAEDITREMREVRERDYFFIASFSVWGLWAGIGLAALWQRLAESFSETAVAGTRSLLHASPVLALALVPLALNWGWASRASDYSARDWAYNLLNSAEPYAVLFTNGDNDTFPLWYLQEVEGLRQDVTVIVMSYLNTPWYVRQLRDLTRPCEEGMDPAADPTLIVCQRPFRADLAPAFYAETDSARRPPTRSIFDLSDEDIDALHASYRANPGSFFVARPLAMSVGRLEWEVPPGRVLTPGEVFMLHIIQNSLEDRPIYYATTTGTYEPLGLDRHIVRQGLAFRLSDGPVETGPETGVFEMPQRLVPATGPYLDLERTDTLLRDVFVHRGGIPDGWDKWVDNPTSSIPLYYAFAHYAVADTFTRLDESEAAVWHLDRADAWQALGQR